MKRKLIHHLQHLRSLSNALLDYAAVWLIASKSRHQGTPVQSAQHVIRLGMFAVVTFFGVGGLWSALAPLDSASVAPGHVVNDSNRKTIQHLEGGIVDAILVQEGEEVKAGQPLIRLANTASKAKMQSLSVQYFTARTTQARLIAERDEKQEIDMGALPSGRENNEKEESEIIANQKRIFEAHVSAKESQINIIRQKIEQHAQEMQGLSEQEKSESRQIALLNEEIGPIRRLLEKGYASKPRLSELQREQERLRGERGRNIAAIAQSKQAIAEAELQIENIRQQFMADTVKELKETQSQIAELEEQMRSSADVLGRVVISAPLDGFITGLNVHTIGGVIAPGEKLMDIVPKGEKLIVEARVPPQDIDVVHPGLTAHMRLTAYKSRHMPMVDGKVVTVSADHITDPRTNETYYMARIETDEEQLKALKNVKLTPGMPADVLIVTGSRTLLAYLFDPFSETMNRSFRED